MSFDWYHSFLLLSSAVSEILFNQNANYYFVNKFLFESIYMLISQNNYQQSNAFFDFWKPLLTTSVLMMYILFF